MTSCYCECGLSRKASLAVRVQRPVFRGRTGTAQSPGRRRGHETEKTRESASLLCVRQGQPAVERRPTVAKQRGRRKLNVRKRVRSACCEQPTGK
ncbi:hypothetical protein NDU88_003288 [Pleurodeles waltl]|uniref:Uncharacterized protein n=1 Tax=Pleurodeles waltl TaxID=8319 RepID=A0AAV7WSF3_PLEWA|nr:hypothetical protein NDU88_003288 [Pleurodeles waltl]